jgi:hypothetical protein
MGIPCIARFIRKKRRIHDPFQAVDLLLCTHEDDLAHVVSARTLSRNSLSVPNSTKHWLHRGNSMLA